MDAIEIAKKTLYLNKDLAYIKNASIVEYDIKSAGFSVIKEKKILSDDLISKLELMPKVERNIAIGKLQKTNPNLSKEIVETLTEVRVSFVIHNNIQPENILSIKKDAIFLINVTPKFLQFGEHFQFRPKDSFTSYMYLNGLEIYYSSRTKDFVVKNFKSERNNSEFGNCTGQNIKGMEYGEQVDEFNPNNDRVFLDIKRFMSLNEKLKYESFYEVLKTYQSNYFDRELPKETYREVESGLYSYKGKKYKFINDDMISGLDISNNYIKYILPAIQIMV